MGTRTGIVVGAVLLLTSVPAAARPRVQLRVAGECPTAEMLRRPLARWVQLEDRHDPEWIISVSTRSGVARLTLADRRGQVSLVREIASPDCRAVAEAFAVIVQAQFVELRVLPDPGASQPSPPAPMLAVEPRRSVASAPRSSSPPATVTSTMASAEPPGGSAVFSLAAAGGVGVGFSPGAVQALGQIDASWRPWGGRFVLRGALSAESPTTQQTNVDRVRLTRLSAGAAAGLRTRPEPVWIQVLAGAGLGATIVEPLDLPGDSSRMRAHPAASLAGAVGLTLGSGVSLRAELASAVFLLTDRYSITPEGEVARSPRGTAFFTVGVEWSPGQ